MQDSTVVKISILLPTRGRPSFVYRLFDSLIQTTSDPKSIEIVLYMDADDIASHEISHPELKITKLIRPSGSPMGKITRECYGASRGRYIMLMNDDAIFRTQNWDISVMDAFARFHDDIAFVYGNDLEQGEKVPTFPILSRKACEIMGGVCPTGYLNLHIESHLFDIFNQLKRFGHNRIVYLNDVIFEHLHYAVGKSDHDRTYVKKDPNFDDRLFITLADERSYVAKKLAAHIESNKPHSRSKPIVSVVVPVFNNNIESSIPCLNIITGTNIEKTPFEVIVVSMGLTDEIPSYLLNLQGKIKIIYDQEKLTFASVYNKAAKESRGEHLVFLNSGNVPEPGWIDALVKIAKTSNDIAAVGCKLLNPRNGRIHHAGICFLNDNGKLKFTYIYRGFRADNPAVNKIREFQAVSGDCMLVKKDIFLEGGGFDGDINGREDIALCLKIRKQGMRVLYTPEAIIYHHCKGEGLSECRTCSQDSYITGSNWSEKIESDLERCLNEDGFSLCKTGNTYHISPR